MKIAVENITKIYSGARKRPPALADVSYSFGKGTTALLGHNGCGKSTLLKILAAVEKSTQGRVLVNGRPMEEFGTKNYLAETGYVPQNFVCMPTMSVLDTMKYSAWVKEIKQSPADDEIVSLLNAVGLLDELKTKTNALSGGQMRRLGIAAALLGNPSLILLDEPTAGLDEQSQNQLYALIENISMDRTVIISTHQTQDVRNTNAVPVHMAKGRIIAPQEEDCFNG